MKKKHDPPPVRDRPPAMFVGDKVPPPAPVLPAERKKAPASPTSPEPGDRSWFRDFFRLPPEPGEGQSRVQPATGGSDGEPDDDSDDESRNKAVGCLALVVLMVVSEVMESVLPLSDGERYLGMAGFVVVLVPLKVWMDLHDSDVAWRDRDSKRWMARFRNRLRRLFKIPVI